MIVDAILFSLIMFVAGMMVATIQRVRGKE